MKKSGIFCLGFPLTVIVFALVFAACIPFEGSIDEVREKAGSNGPFTVTFNANGGSPVPGSQEVERGGKVGIPISTAIYDVEFGGWYKESSLTNKWDFDKDTVTKNITLYAKWNFSLPLNDVKYIEPYLNYKTGGISVELSVNFNLGNTTLPASNWQRMLNAIDTAGSWIDLDLSGCGMNGTAFDPCFTFVTGKDKIVSLIFPDAAESIAGVVAGQSNFKNFSNLKNVKGLNITEIGDYAFYGCNYLVSIDFENLNELGEEAFCSCHNLVNVSLPLLEYVGYGVFAGCIKLINLSFPNLKEIGQYAFNGCSSLTSIRFPRSVELFANPFRGCYSLTLFTLDGTGDLQLSYNSAAIIKEKTLIAYPSVSGVLQTYTDIEIYGEEAFYGAVNLTKVISDYVIEIKDFAFLNCTNLQEVETKNVTTIDNAAFEACESLESVNFPELLTANGNYIFGFCTSLVSANLPKLKVIGGMFAGCTNLETVNIPAVTRIYGEFSNTGTKQLTITMGSTPPDVNGEMFYDVSNPKKVIVKVPEGSEANYLPSWRSDFIQDGNIDLTIEEFLP